MEFLLYICPCTSVNPEILSMNNKDNKSLYYIPIDDLATIQVSKYKKAELKILYHTCSVYNRLRSCIMPVPCVELEVHMTYRQYPIRVCTHNYN